MTAESPEKHFDPALLLQDQTLTTERTRLLPVQNSDEVFLYPHMADPSIAGPMSWNAHTELEQTREVVQRLIDNRQRGTGITWCIYLRNRFDDGRLQDVHSRANAFAGIFSLIDITGSHRSLRYDKAELAYWLVPAHQGSGLMTEVGRCIVEHAYTTLCLHKLVVGHMDTNARSRGLIERLGFRIVGVERSHFEKDGNWHDHHIYEMLDNERPTSL